jgi:hypothetical protein
LAVPLLLLLPPFTVLQESLSRSTLLLLLPVL